MSATSFQFEELEHYAVSCMERLQRIKVENWTPTIYESSNLDEISWRLSALTQLVGELDYWLGNSGQGQSFESPLKDYLEVDKKDFWATVRNVMSSPNTLIDLGSGVRPSTLWSPNLHICVEIFEPYQVYLKDKFKDRPLVIISEDVLSFLKRQPDRSLDTIFASDVIEHLPKEDGIQFLQEIERTTRSQALIFTPNGFMPQHVGIGNDGWGWTGNSKQDHISGWLPSEFPDWEIIYSPNYHLEKDGYEDGAFAAIYFPPIEEREKHLTIVLEDETKDPGFLVNELSSLGLLDHSWAIEIISPISMSLGSHQIRPEQTKEKVNQKFISFNLEIRRPNNVLKDHKNSSMLGLFGLVDYLKTENKNKQTVNIVISRKTEFLEKLKSEITKDESISNRFFMVNPESDVDVVSRIHQIISQEITFFVDGRQK